MLEWEVFEGRYPANALIEPLFKANGASSRASNVSTGLSPLDDEHMPSLIDAFLQNVHTKNPILDVQSLVKHGRECAANGIGWDSWSCMVLLACALGSIADPFDAIPPSVAARAFDAPSAVTAPPPRPGDAEYRQAECYFALARRRLGTLGPSLLASQCHFFTGGMVDSND